MKAGKLLIKIIEMLEACIEQYLFSHSAEIEKSVIDAIEKLSNKLIAWLNKHKI